MKRRSGTGGERVKARSRKATTLKRRDPPKATRNRGVSVTGQETVVARLTHERDEALLRETANAEILRLISKSPGDLELVFRTILEHATRICNAEFGVLDLYDGDAFRSVAHFNTPTALLEALTRRGPFKPPRGSPFDQVMRTRKVFHSADNAADPVPSLAAKVAGARSLVAVPMLKDDQLLGIIIIYRQEVLPFTDKQIELVQNFAAQAVIAIENARLLNELKQRTADLSESLEQQTATSEVLKVISSSPSELEPVFQATLENATRLCEAKFGVIFYYSEGTFHPVAELNPPTAYSEFIRQRGSFPPAPGSTFEHLIRTKEVINLTDATAQGPFSSNAAAKFGGARSQISVPMLKEDELIGAIAIYRQQVRPFTGKQIELVKNFAAQAVIAIENARLLNELSQRTDDLREALQQQTATAEVLKVIARTRGELQPVFETMLANATELCGASYGALWLRVEDGFRYAALHGDLPQIWTDHLRSGTVIRVRPDVPLARMLQTLRPVSIPDMRTDTGYLNGDPLPVSGVDIGGIRTLVVVPMIKNNDLIGAIAIYRKEVRPFAEKQIELLQNFAAQAVIAIENARLLGELRESLQQQTATADVLKVISSSPGDLRPVFEAMLENAVRICEAAFGSMLQREGDCFRRVALHNAPMDYEKYSKAEPFLRPTKTLAHILETKQTAQVADMAVAEPQSPITRLGGARTLLNVPMIKDDVLIGAITIFRQEVRPFPDKQIALLQNFAAQAVIAIENVRLLKELRERTDQLANLNQQLEQRVFDQVGEIERMSRLRRFLPPQVADLIVASGAEKHLESHRREITALFCDLRGFTGFSESSDPEDVMALLAQYHAAIGEIIIKYSGTLERYAGDGVMVIFNDPVPVENPALQAVLMALEMRAAIGGLIEKWRDLGHDLGFGIGIAHGFATLGTIGFEGRRDYAAIGTVSNVASRLCDEAKPGQILISPRVRQAVDKAVTVEPVGEFALKGIRRPMVAYNVLESSPSKPN